MGFSCGKFTSHFKISWLSLSFQLPIPPTLLEETRTFSSNLKLMFAYFEELVMKGFISRLFLIFSD